MNKAIDEKAMKWNPPTIERRKKTCYDCDLFLGGACDGFDEDIKECAYFVDCWDVIKDQFGGEELAEYIEKSAVVDKLNSIDTNRFHLDAEDVVEQMLYSVERLMPTADVSPVVHGRWIEGAENFTCGNHNAECSVCGANISWNGCDEDFNYCPPTAARRWT